MTASSPGDPREHLIQLARGGDRDALLCLIEAAPRPLPPRALALFRNQRIRATADWLRSILPSCTEREIAAIVADAGNTLRRRGAFRQISAAMMLAESDRRDLLDKLADAVAIEGDKQWLSERQIREIVALRSGKKITPVSSQRSVAC